MPLVLWVIFSGAVFFGFARQIDTIAPRVTLVEPGRGEVISTNLVRFKAQVSDTGSGIARVVFILRYFDYLDTTEDQRKSDTIAVLHAPPWECMFDMRNLPDQDMWRLVPEVRAYDSAGNHNGVLARYIVLDRNPNLSSRSVSAHFVSRAVAIDGDLSEWDAPVDSFENGNNMVQFSLMWDVQNLYAAVWVWDSDIVCMKGLSPWLFDDIELFFDTRADRSSIRQPDDKQIIITPCGTVRPWLVDIASDTQYVWSNRIAVVVDTTAVSGSGYCVEIAIPWHDLLDGNQPRNNMAIGFDLFNSDRDGRESYRTGFSWAGNPRHNNSNPSEWGTLVLHRKASTMPWLAAMTLLVAGGAGVWWFLRRYRSAKSIYSVEQQTQELTTSEKIVADAQAFVEQNFTNESLCLTDVARSLGLNSNYLSGVFKKTSGSSFPQYLTSVRLREAKRQLRDTSSSVATIALSVGFSSANALQRAFRLVEHCTPRQYRKKVNPF
jgi:AraC-like DNA-binding protein